MKRKEINNRKTNMRGSIYRSLIIAAMLAVMMSMAALLAGCTELDLSGSDSDQGQAEGSSGTAGSGLVSFDEYEDVDNIASLDQEIPEYNGQDYVTINGNEPEFSKKQLKNYDLEKYGKLDELGRCTGAIANIDQSDMPDRKHEERGDISDVHPSGWKSGMRWERCHLIAWMLTGQNANERNLITGTHHLNYDVMVPIEQEVGNYIERTGNHVLYEVVPVFRGSDLIASGIQMQAESVEDNGEGISYNIFCFNVNPGVSINYANGIVITEDPEEVAKQSKPRQYVLNTNTMKFHYPSCSGVSDISKRNKKTVTESRIDLLKEGYEPCGQCQP